MEVLFENDSTITEELFLEFAKSTMKGWYQIICYIMSAILVAISGVILYQYFVNEKGNPVIGAAAFFIGWGIFSWGRKFYSFIGKRTYQKQLQINQVEAIHKVVQFGPEHAQILSDNGKKTTLDYKKIKKEVMTDSLYIIEFEDSAGICIRKDSFTKGSLEEVRAFLQKAKQA